MRRNVTIGVVAALVLVGTALLWPRGPKLSNEQQITNTILEVKQAVEARSVGGVMKHIAEEYDDGVNTKRDLTRLAISAFRTEERFNVYLEPPEVTVTGDRARAHIRAEFWLGQSVSPEDRQPLELDVELVRTRRGWKVIGATGWEAASGEVD